MTRKTDKIKDSEICEGTDDTNPRGNVHLLAYILAMSGELAATAADKRQGLLAYLLAMAREEAERLSRDPSRPPI